MVYHVKLNERDRLAIVAYQNACRAGWREESCRFIASMIVDDDQRLSRILYQVKVSEPVAFRPGHGKAGAAIRCVD